MPHEKIPQAIQQCLQIDTWHAAAPQRGDGEFCFGRKKYRRLSCIYVPIKALKVQCHHDISLYNSSLEVYAMYPDLILILWHKSQYLLFILYVSLTIRSYIYVLMSLVHCPGTTNITLHHLTTNSSA